MKNTLIVVDMQKGFTISEQTVYLKEKIMCLLEQRIFDCVVATRFINKDNSVYERLLSWNQLKLNEEYALIEGLDKYVDYIEDKDIYTCVNGDFVRRLCELNEGEYPEYVFIAGVDTDCCVLKIAVDLFEQNIRPIVLTNYCASNGGVESHKAGLLCMKRLIGAKQLKDGEYGEELFRRIQAGE